MREILFRGKKIDNGQWTYGDLNQLQDSTIIHTYENGCRVADYVYRETICQYTGLKDSEGTKIFEGDILKLTTVTPIEESWIALVEFGNPNGEYNWGFQLKYIAGDKFNPDILLWVDMEETGAFCKVIGNIFDNSNLLGGN